MRKYLVCALHLIRAERMKCAEQVARIKGLTNPHKILFNKPESERLVGEPRRRREDHIKNNFKHDMKGINCQDTSHFALCLITRPLK